MTIYLEDWAEGGEDQLIKDFWISKEDLIGVEIVYAYYLYHEYEGQAFVLFIKDNELFEVNGSHCSCYGLEGQWDPESTVIAAIRKRNFYHIDESQLSKTLGMLEERDNEQLPR